MTPLRVLALVPYALGTAPSQRYRLEQWAPQLSTTGVELVLQPFADPALSAILHRPGRMLRKAWLMAAAFRRRVRLMHARPACNAAVVHRAACLAGPPIVERWLHARGVPLVYDFDDAIFLLHAAAANRRLAWLKTPGKTGTICKLVDHVVVCNSFLEAYAREHNSRVSVIPSSIDTGAYKPKAPRAKKCVVVGWMGSSTSQTYLEEASAMLRALLRARPVELRVVSDRRPELPGVLHTWHEWSAEREVEELAEFDVGIMPMPDDDWARGKCAFKALQYMAMGIGTVAAAVGTNREIIQHGQNGLLAREPQEWLDCILALVDDTERRRCLGEAGRRTVEERFSMHASADAFGRVLRTVVDSRGVAV